MPRPEYKNSRSSRRSHVRMQILGIILITYLTGSTVLHSSFILVGELHFSRVKYFHAKLCTKYFVEESRDLKNDLENQYRITVIYFKNAYVVLTI